MGQKDPVWNRSVKKTFWTLSDQFSPRRENWFGPLEWVHSEGTGDAGGFDSTGFVGAAGAQEWQDRSSLSKAGLAFGQILKEGWPCVPWDEGRAVDQKDMVFRRAMRNRKKGQPRTEVMIPIGISEGAIAVRATRSARIISRAPDSAERGMSFL